MSKNKFKIIFLSIILPLSFCFYSCNNFNNKKNVDFITIGEIKCGFDDQIFFYTTHDIVRTEEGYYFINDRNIMQFYDLSSKKTVPVCSQPNCLHTADNEGCDANLSLIQKVYGLWYYDNGLYIISYDYENYVYYLCRISKDGSKRTRCSNLLSLDPETTEKGVSGGDIHNLMIHRGFVYFTADENENRTSIFKVSIKRNSKPQIIYSCDKNSYISGIKGYGNGIYFKKADLIKNSKYEYVNMLVYYDTSQNVCKTYNISEGFDYFPYKSNIYVSTEQKLSLLDTLSSKMTTIYQSDFLRNFSFDGKYFYIDNYDTTDKNKERFLTVVDMNGKAIDRIIIKNGFYCVFGDDKYTFCYWRKENSLILRGFDKSQIGTDSRNWIDLR